MEAVLCFQNPDNCIRYLAALAIFVRHGLDTIRGLAEGLTIIGIFQILSRSMLQSSLPVVRQSRAFGDAGSSF
jgi:hypothetical protein